MRKLLLLLLALLTLGGGRAWAETITVTTGSALWTQYGTWEAYTSANWGTTWKSTNGKVCVTSATTGYINRKSSQIATTNVTIWTPGDDVMVTGYSITFKSNAAANSAISGAMQSATSTGTDDEQTITVSGIYSHNALFNVGTNYANIVSFTVEVETLPAKSDEGYYFIKNPWDNNSNFYLCAQPSTNAAKVYKVTKTGDAVADMYTDANYVWKIVSYGDYRIIQNVATSRYITNFNAANLSQDSRDGSYVDILNSTEISDAEIFTVTDRSSNVAGAVAFLSKSKSTDCWLNCYNSNEGGAVGFHNASHAGDRMLLTRAYKVTLKTADDSGNEVESDGVPVNGVAVNEVYVPANTELSTISGSKFFIDGTEKTAEEVKTAISNVSDDNLVVYVTPLPTTVTINIKQDDTTIATKQLDVIMGRTYDIVSSLGYQARFMSTTPASVTGTSENQTIDVQATFTLPFKVVSDPATDATAANAYYLTLNSKYAKGNQLTADLDRSNKDYLWTIGGDYINGFTLYNQGQAQYLVNGTTDNSVASFGETGTKYILYSNTSDGFYLKVDGSDHNYLNDYSSNGVISTWGEHDLIYYVENGSASSFTGSKLTARNVATDLSEVYTYLNQRTIGTALGQYHSGDYTEDNRTAALAAASTAYNDGDAPSVAASAQPLWTIKDGMAINTPAEGQFVYFKSHNNSRYAKAVDTNDAAVQMQTSDGEPTIDNIFAFVGNKFVSYSKGRYIENTRDMSALGAEGSTFEILESDLPGMYFVKCGTNYLYGYDTGHDNVAKLDRLSTTVGYEQQCRWYIQEVTALPVTIGESGYATFYSPAALTLNEGLTAYVGKINGAKDVLTLTATNIIPANQGVILEGAEGDYNLTVGGSSNLTSDITGSVATIRTPEQGAYTLTLEDSKPVFKKFTGETLTGFKAYIDGNTVAGVKSLNIEFLSDAISALQASKQEGRIFDLNGRRVEKIQKGIYIVNGRKVVIK